MVVWEEMTYFIGKSGQFFFFSLKAASCEEYEIRDTADCLTKTV